jgi:hypothetical protein
MSATTWFGTTAPEPRSSLRRLARRVPRGIWILLLILASWGVEYGLYRAFEPPGLELRHELQGAANELGRQAILAPIPDLAQDIRGHFREANVAVDLRRDWPNVAVSLGDVPRPVCASAVREAGRIDGLVVVSLQHYRSPADCRAANDMTWLLMP